MDTLTTTATRLDRLDPAAAAGAECVLCDLDGCLASEGRAYEDAQAFAEACGTRLWIVSNNSTDTADTLSLTLHSMGLSVPAERIVLAGEQTLHHLARRGMQVQLYAAPPLRRLAAELGIDGGAGAATVLLCRDPEMTLGGLGQLATVLSRGAALWVANTDSSHPGRHGALIAETGAALAALQAMVPRLRFNTLGKPAPHLVEIALERAGLPPGSAVFVGDNPATDGLAAQQAGVRFLHLTRMEAQQ